MPIGRWGTVGEAAGHYGVSRQRIHQLIAKGSFPGSRRMNTPRGPVWLIPYPFKRKVLLAGRPRERSMA